MFVDLCLTADRPFLRHATGLSGNGADAFGGPHCRCHGVNLNNFTFCKRTHHNQEDMSFDKMCYRSHTPLHVALGERAPAKWKFTCDICGEVRARVSRPPRGLLCGRGGALAFACFVPFCRNLFLFCMPRS